MLSIHYIMFAPDMGFLGHDEVDYKTLIQQSS